MCGIAGVLNLKPGRPSRCEMERMVALMLEDMPHRGPDGHDIMATDDVALGHRRLAIIDLTDAGRQPMCNRDQTVWVVVNGEIYNHKDLMSNLKAAGHGFHSNCDSEVAVHGYVESGAEMFKSFNGMWGMAVWDDVKKRLLLSRDRIGVKPLFYFRTNDYFIFASETKPLLHFLPRPIRHNRSYLFKMLQWDLDDPQETPYEDIHPIPASSVVTVTPDGKLEIERYWSLSVENTKTQLTERQAVDQFMELFSDAVRLRMISDAPVTFFLSGGIDSASVVGAARKLAGPGLSTISSVFLDQGFDEGQYIQDLIKAYDVRPMIISPEPNGRLIDLLQKIVWHLDGPATAQGTLLQWFLFKTAHDLSGCKVVLSGNGGDEVMGGYHPYYRPYLNSLIRDYHATRDRRYLWRFLRDSLALKRKLGRNYVFNSPVSCFEGKARTRMQRYREWLAGPPSGLSPTRMTFLNDGFVDEMQRQLEGKPGSEFIEDQVALGLQRTIMPGLLKNEDRMSMAWSVEARHPFLDYRLIELLCSMDYRLKTKGISNKHLARIGMKGIMPESARKRIDKMGLPTPLANWLRGTERESCREFLSSAFDDYSEMFDGENFRRIFELHQTGDVDVSKKVYIALTTATWLQQLRDASMKPDFWRLQSVA